MSDRIPELVICRGLQGSGKTTWATGWVAQDRKHRVRLNKDSLRKMIDDGVYIQGVTEQRVLLARDALVKQFMTRGYSVVVDDTNLVRHHVRTLAGMAHVARWPWRVQDFTDVPLEECIRRDYQRFGTDGYIGATIIRDNYYKYLHGRRFELPEHAELDEIEAARVPYLPPANGTPGVMVDVDGTVALLNGRNPFDETTVLNDLPNQWVIDLVKRDAADGLHVIFCSGRSGNCLSDTLEWLQKYVIELPFDLYMREPGDNRADNIVKQEIFDSFIRPYFDVRRVYDDRNQVVEMWRSLGLNVLQVAPGAF